MKSTRKLLWKVKKTPICKKRWLLNGFLFHKMFNLLFWSSNAFQAEMLNQYSSQCKLTKFWLLILVRKIHILAKNMVPRVFHQTRIFHTPRFPLDPAFFTPRDPETPYPGTPAPRFPPSRFVVSIAEYFYSLIVFWLALRLVKIQSTSKNSQRYYTTKRLIRVLLSNTTKLLCPWGRISNRSSGVRVIFVLVFWRYLYFTKCSWK